MIPVGVAIQKKAGAASLHASGGSGAENQRRSATPAMVPGATTSSSKKTTDVMGEAAATPLSKIGESASRGSSKSPVESKTPDPTSSLLARLGGMVLLDKEAEGLVFDEPV